MAENPSPATLRVRAVLENLRVIRRFVAEQATGAGYPSQRVDDLVLAVDEAATNIVMHGYGQLANPDEPVIEAEVTSDERLLSVTLRDQAPPFDPTAMPVVDELPPIDRARAGGPGHLPHAQDHGRDPLPADAGRLERANAHDLPVAPLTTGGMIMELTVTSAPSKPGVAIVALAGDLDASNYLQVIQKVDGLYQGGARALIFDLSDTEFVSSSGLVAIHSIAMLMQGQRPPNPEDGWGAIRAIERGPGDRARECVKLVNPQPRVASTLSKVGFTEVLETYPSVEAALAAL